MANAYQDKSKETNAEVSAIKEDVKDIVKRIKNLKGDALQIFSQGSEDLASDFSSIKDSLTGQAQTSLKHMYDSVEKNPLKSALYFFGAGIVISLLLKK